MANALATPYKQRLLDPNMAGGGGVGIDMNTDTIKVVALTSGYVFSAAHDMLDDLVVASNSPTSGGTSTLTSPTVTNGVFDADDTTLTAVTTGFTITQLWVYKD